MEDPELTGGANYLLTTKVGVDVFILLLYSSLYCFRNIIYYVENHILWAFTMRFALFLPGVSIVVGILLEGSANSKRVIWKFVLIIFAPTLWILWLAFKTIYQDEHSLQEMTHTWSFKGLMEIPFLLLIQLHIFLQRTPVGSIFSFPNGRSAFHIFEIFVSFFIFLYTIGKYHNLLDNNFNSISTIRVFPYFAINILFRTFTLAVIFLYVNYLFQPLMFLILFILYSSNVYITYKWSLKFNATNPHKIFSSFIGGIISILTPAFGCFFGETSTGKCIRSYYQMNTYIINMILGALFFITSMFLIGDYNDNNTYINQFPLAGCHPRNYTFAQDGDEFGFNDEMEKPIFKDNFTFLGSHWTVRLGNKYENTSVLSTKENEGPVFLVAQLCQGDFTYFHFFAGVVPVVIILLILSTLSAVFIDSMGIKYRNEDIEDEDNEMV